MGTLDTVFDLYLNATPSFKTSIMAKDPITVVITGAAGQIGYSLIYMVSSGYVFGADQSMILHLLDIEPMMGVLGGVVMEIDDCAFPRVKKVVPTADPEVAFKDADAAFMVGAMPRKQGMERKDLLAANVKIFLAISDFAREKLDVTGKELLEE